MSEERWMPVVGYPAYEVSDQGRVRGRIRTVRSGHIRRQAKDKFGYWVVCLSRDDVAKTKKVHVLVLEAFVCPRPEGMQAAHSNGKRDDARLSNLSWKTISENQGDRVGHGTDVRGERNAAAKLTAADVLKIRALIGTRSQREIGIEFGVQQACISAIHHGRSWKHLTA